MWAWRNISKVGAPLTAAMAVAAAEKKPKKMLNKYKNWLCRGLPVKLKVKQGEGSRGEGGSEVRNKTENKRNVNERESDGRLGTGGGGVLPAGCAGNQSWKLGNKIKRTATKRGTRGRGRSGTGCLYFKQSRVANWRVMEEGEGAGTG